MIYSYRLGSNVCTHPEKNPCKYYCTDEQEGVSCHCPQGMSGDGKKIGTGCRKDFPTNTILGNFSYWTYAIPINDYLLFSFHFCSIYVILR
jgi:hypothetical protein